MNKNLNIKSLIIDKPLKLDCGQTINNFPLAYETYGSLNEKKNNAILVFHALTGDQFVSGINPITKKDGWWSRMVGPGKNIDTNKFFVICSNVLGGCSGTSGPNAIDTKTKVAYGGKFPSITIKTPYVKRTEVKKSDSQLRIPIQNFQIASDTSGLPY